MKLAILSYAYAPSLGGIESVSRLVADGLSSRGHDVTVVTKTPGESDDEFRVVRDPSPAELVRILKSVDAVVQSNVSLSLSWPLMMGVVRRRWVVVNHTPIARTDGRRTIKDRLKIMSLPANTYSVSRFLQEQTVPAVTRIMPNPFDDRVFSIDPRIAKRPAKHLLFVGRLAAVKGLDLLLRALAALAESDEGWRLTVVGDGPEREELVTLADRLGVESLVDFVGRRSGKELADVMRVHRVVVMPSRTHPAEAFPLVPLEAIACGCVVVGSHVGGLPEAIGQHGVLVPPDDLGALENALRTLASDPLAVQRITQQDSPASRHTIAAVAKEYERSIETAYVRRAAPRSLDTSEQVSTR